MVIFEIQPKIFNPYIERYAFHLDLNFKSS